ncbi:MAG: S41 family peptidase [Wenzhouxiangellaceae bacterium]|nr:MAG: S41 family peptidase [Wenzhouxiangellaceae bacterium]
MFAVPTSTARCLMAAGCCALGLVLAGPLRAGGQVSVEDLRAFADAWGYIKENFVEELDDRRLFEAAIRGMLSELDEHSAWLSGDDLDRVEEQASGRYGGLGLRIVVQDDHLRVVEAMGNSPAQRAGLVADDRIVAINDTELNASNSREALNWLRGSPGSRVELIVERDGEAEPRYVVLHRELINRSSVSLEPLEDGYWRLHIRQFQHNTADELDQLLSTLRTDHGLPPGLVLDLRDNPGGVLQAAVAVADRFLSEQLVVYTEGRNEGQNLSLGSGVGESLPGVPVVVLINRGSASAAEIVAGALQDHGRAIILGQRSHGKGSIQTVWPLRNGGGVRLTTARYYTPSGRRIEAGGIEPDELIADEDMLQVNGSDPVLARALQLFRSAERLYRGSGQLD